MFIIITVYAQINSAKLILKLLRYVSVLIHNLQGVTVVLAKDGRGVWRFGGGEWCAQGSGGET